MFWPAPPSTWRLSLNANVSVCSGDLGYRGKIKGDERVRRIMQAVAADPSQDIADLARLVNLSSSRLSHLFKLETGCSLRAYLVDCRLEMAALVLRRTDTSVKAVSYNVGYGHPPSFVRAFRKQFDCSPKEYRDRQQRLRISS